MLTQEKEKDASLQLILEGIQKHQVEVEQIKQRTEKTDEKVDQMLKNYEDRLQIELKRCVERKEARE